MAITEKESAATRPVGVSPNVVVTLAVVIVLFVVTALFYLTLAGRDIQSIVPVLSGFAIPTVVAILGLVKTDRQGSSIETIRKNTNGAFERMEQRMARLEQPVHDALNTGEIPSPGLRESDEPQTEAFPFDFRTDPPKGGSRNG